MIVDCLVCASKDDIVLFWWLCSTVCEARFTPLAVFGVPVVWLMACWSCYVYRVCKIVLCGIRLQPVLVLGCIKTFLGEAALCLMELSLLN